MKKCLLILAALTLLMPLALRAQMSQTNSFSGTPNFSGTLVFDKLNAAAAGWTVTQVVVTSTLNIDGFSLMVTNTSGDTASVNSYSFGANNRVIIVPIGATNVVTAATSATPGPDLNAHQGMLISGTAEQASHTWTLTSSNQVSQFLGSGTFNVTYKAIQESTVSQSGGVQSTLNPSTSWGSVIVNFFYAIPEPSTWAMIGAASLMFLVLKRRRA
jgi:hypothetical protein